MPVKYLDHITRKLVQANPLAVFVFGDNLERVGLGGQAGAMRGEPNAIGVATKRAPGQADGDFFADTAECRDILLEEIKRVSNALDDGQTVYVPSAGLGTGLSELPKRAPKLAQLLVDRFRRFDGDPCPWPDVIGHDGRGLIAVKGFDKNLTCAPIGGIPTTYEIGQTLEMDGNIAACKRGYHACLHPLDVFRFYAPAGNRFAEVILDGKLGFHNEDTKVAAAKITISAELTLPEIVQRAVKWVTDRAFPEGPVASGDQGAATASGDQGAATASGTRGAATASGYQGAATASGTRGAATASGYQGAATASGDQGAATASGDQGAATASGDQGAATASGYQGAATASGINGKARGKDGSALFLVYRRDDWSGQRGEILHVWSGIVGRNGIKPDTWYSLSSDGQPFEVDA